MIQLHKDLFVKLSVSAKIHKTAEVSKKVEEQTLKNSISPLEVIEYTEPSPKKLLEEKKTEKDSGKRLAIDETVEQLIDNPEVKALRKELEKVEQMFISLKDVGDMDLIMRIDKKIDQLKRLIDDKSYV